MTEKGTGKAPLEWYIGIYSGLGVALIRFGLIKQWVAGSGSLARRSYHSSRGLTLTVGAHRTFKNATF